MKHEIRVKKTVLFLEVLLPAIMFVGLLVSLLIVGVKTKFNIYWTGMFIFIAWSFIQRIRNDWLPIIKHKFIIDDQKMIVCFLKGRLELDWQDIKSAKLEQDQKPYNLSIGTDEGFYELPLENFHSRQLWELIKERMPSKSLENEAYKDSKGYRQWQAEAKEIISTMHDPIKIVDSKIMDWIGWITTLLFVGLSVLFLYLGEAQGLSLLFIPFAILGIIIILSYGQSIVDTTCIIRKNRIGQYRIEWNEVESVEASPMGDAIAFKGNGKQVVIPGPIYWESTEAEAFNKALSAMLENRKIVVAPNKWTAFKFCKNSRI